MSIYICDIDNTICKTKGDDYENAKPYKKRIEKMNDLYEKGHTIIYETARGQQTGINWDSLTRRQFKEWGVKCLTLSEKHYADYYIDDHGVNAKEFFK